MMDKIKAFFGAIWGYIALAAIATIGVLAWLLNIKNKQLEADKERIALAQTQKDADLIETDIKAKMADINTSDKDKAAMQQSLDLLDKKRQSLSDPRTTDQQKEDYWNKK